MSDAKLFLVGYNGFIGQWLYKTLNPRWPVQVVSSTKGLSEGAIFLDLAEPESFDISAVSSGDIILLTAAISSPDFCRDHFDRAYQINVTGAIRFTKMILDAGARVIFFSSDAIYGANQDEVTEADAPSPAGPYGRMKFEVEQRFLGHQGFKALRLSYVLASNDKFTSYLKQCVDKSEVARIYDPFDRRVVAISEVLSTVEIVCEYWDSFSQPVLNLCGPDLLSRADIARKLQQLYLKDLKFEVAAAPAGFYDSRPPVINMNSLYLQELLGRPLKPALDAIKL